MPKKKSDFPLWLTEGKPIRVGHRVVPSEEGREHKIVQKRVTVGTVTKVEKARGGGANYVTVLWDGYRRPHSYAACFIDRARKTDRSSPSSGE